VTQPPAKIVHLLASLDIAPARIAQKNLLLQREPAELVIAAIGDDGREHRLTRAAATAWRAMSAVALGDGVTLKIVSAFRSVERQAEIVRAKLARGILIDAILEVSAPPGYSEHHTGRAIDVTTDGVPALELEFERTAAFRWLLANAARFGFFLSYPEGNAHGYAYEPWHWCHKA
jgi:D-alanyl-D-alanine carboxypeptidase